MEKRDGDGAPEGAGEPSAIEGRDVVFVYGKSEDGDYGVVRKRDEMLELGRIRPMKEGQPIHGEVVNLKPRRDSPQLFDVDVLHDPRPEGARSGPAQVATRAYRENWDQVFGGKRLRGPGALDN